MEVSVYPLTSIVMARQFKEDMLCLPYFREMIEERGKNADSKGSYGNWKSCLRYLEIYCDEKTTFREVTPEFVQGFKDYLDVADKKDFKRGPNAPKRVYEKLSTNTKVSYFNKLRACINHAFNERIIPTNPIIGITGFKAEEVKRDYLTFDEVKLLANTPCVSPLLKRAFLFSCLTGLRTSDIEKLTWDGRCHHRFIKGWQNCPIGRPRYLQSESVQKYPSPKRITVQMYTSRKHESTSNPVLHL